MVVADLVILRGVDRRFIHRRPNTKLTTEISVNPPYTQPTFCPSQTAAGDPAKSARMIGTISGVQHGLVMQAIPNMTAARTFLHMVVFLPMPARLWRGFVVYRR
jgi:hypothetical protein